MQFEIGNSRYRIIFGRDHAVGDFVSVFDREAKEPDEPVLEWDRTVHSGYPELFTLLESACLRMLSKGMQGEPRWGWEEAIRIVAPKFDLAKELDLFYNGMFL